MPDRTITVALAGNPNSGKTTIFNNLTGMRQHVGNYPGVTVEMLCDDGSPLRPGDVAARVTGKTASIHCAERTAINFIAYLSGIATTTERFVAAARSSGNAVTKTDVPDASVTSIHSAALRRSGCRPNRALRAPCRCSSTNGTNGRTRR